MDPHLKEKLRNLPALNPIEASAQAKICKICESTSPIFDVVDLQKHCSYENQYQYGLSGIQVPYHRCNQCGFLFTTFFDNWTSPDWSRFIYNADYVKVDPDYVSTRPERLAESMAKLLVGCESIRILDYGSGSGVFGQKMNEAGFRQVESYDPFSSPHKPEGYFDLITCFEVLEHTPWPRETVRDMRGFLATNGCLVFSQSIQPVDIQAIRSAWWYVAPRNGHISTFTADTLLQMFSREGNVLHGNGWLWAVTSSDTVPKLKAVAAKIGAAVTSLVLRAPGQGQDDQWHAREGEFRWSGRDALVWPIKQPDTFPAFIQIRIPFQMEAYAGFAAACSMKVGNLPAQTSASESEIVAEILLSSPLANPTVTLHTPPPRSPFELRQAPDARLLGLRLPTPPLSPANLNREEAPAGTLNSHVGS